MTQSTRLDQAKYRLLKRVLQLGQARLSQKAYAVVELLQDADVEELVHVDAVLEQEPDKVNPVAVESLVHGVLQSPVGPVLTCQVRQVLLCRGIEAI